MRAASSGPHHLQTSSSRVLEEIISLVEFLREDGDTASAVKCLHIVAGAFTAAAAAAIALGWASLNGRVGGRWGHGRRRGQQVR